MLCGSYLIVLGLCAYAQLPQLHVKILHVLVYPVLDIAVVVVIKLLSSGSLCPEEGAPCVDEILSLVIEPLVYKEVFLFRAYGGGNSCGIRAEELQYPERLFGDDLHGTQQGCLLVKYLPCVGAEGSRNVQSLILDECGRSGIPCGVAPCLEGGAQSSRRE